MTKSNTASDFNLTRVSTKEFGENLRATIEYGGNIFVCGRRGGGKSAISSQGIKESGFKEIFLSTSVFDRCDFGGFPRVLSRDESRKYIDYLLPYFYEFLIDGTQKCVLFLDEIDKVDSSVIAPILEVVHDRKINGRALTNLQAIVMTGNLIAEGGSRPSLPLLDRSEKYLMEASTSNWLDWAAKDGKIHPSITAFLNDNQEDLFGDVDPGDVYADPSPRGWHNASKMLQFGEEKKWSHRVLSTKVSGCVGKKVGIKYAAYFDHYQVLLPLVERIMRGEAIRDFDKMENSKQIVCCMIACNRLARLLDTMMEKKSKKLPVESDTVCGFLKTVDPEMSLISVRSQIGLERSLNSGIDENPIFSEILSSISKRING